MNVSDIDIPLKYLVYLFFFFLLWVGMTCTVAVDSWLGDREGGAMPLDVVHCSLYKDLAQVDDLPQQLNH